MRRTYFLFVLIFLLILGHLLTNGFTSFVVFLLLIFPSIALNPFLSPARLFFIYQVMVPLAVINRHRSGVRKIYFKTVIIFALVLVYASFVLNIPTYRLVDRLMADDRGVAGPIALSGTIGYIKYSVPYEKGGDVFSSVELRDRLSAYPKVIALIQARPEDMSAENFKVKKLPVIHVGARKLEDKKDKKEPLADADYIISDTGVNGLPAYDVSENNYTRPWSLDLHTVYARRLEILKRQSDGSFLLIYRKTYARATPLDWPLMLGPISGYGFNMTYGFERHPIAPNGGQASVERDYDSLFGDKRSFSYKKYEGAILQAILNGKVDVVRGWLKTGVDVNARLSDGETLLQKAVKNGEVEIAKLLTEHGADVNAKSFEGKTALAQAVASRNLQMELFLLDSGAKVNEVLGDGGNALFLAIRKDMPKGAMLLMAHGANTHAKNKDGTTPLMEASRTGQLSVAKGLLDHGAEIEAKDDKGLTPLMYAVVQGNADVVAYLISRGADVNAKSYTGQSVLSMARSHGRNEIVKLLTATRSGR
ncbi:MAG: hypothetical protein GC185_08705 [Alphaproteobacteria bacterium]|nr:hypothetical protein [Alphaproteobacteria bacterium]